MSYCLQGDKTDSYGPTIQGMRLLRESVMSRSLQFPVLTDFVLEGQTNNPKVMAIECKEFAQEAQDENLKSTLNHLAEVALANKKELILC